MRLCMNKDKWGILKLAKNAPSIADTQDSARDSLTLWELGKGVCCNEGL